MHILTRVVESIDSDPWTRYQTGTNHDFKNDRIDLSIAVGDTVGDNVGDSVGNSCIVLQELNDDRVSRYIQSNAPNQESDAFRIKAKYNSLFISSFNKIKFAKSEKGFVLWLHFCTYIYINKDN